MRSLIIRADAGGLLGTGHVMRMLALAQAYQRRGGSVVIASLECPKGIVARVEELGFQHIFLSSEELGSERDGDETLALCEKYDASWLVLDGYHFDERYQQQVTGKGVKVLTLDDYGHCSSWFTDAVLNQNLGSEVWASNLSCLPKTKLLLGSSFALIREEFFKGREAFMQSGIQKILITLGGADPDNVTSLVLSAFDKSRIAGVELKVLLGGGNQHREELEKLAKDSRHSIELLVNVRDMPSMYEWADAVVSAGGSTCWEWLAYGLPGAVVTIADNQECIVRELSEQKLALSLGWFNTIDVDEWAHKLEEWIDDQTPYKTSEQRRQIIDCKGADRVAAMLGEGLKITVATAAEGWMRSSIESFCDSLAAKGHLVDLVFDTAEIQSSDVLFLLSFWGLVPDEILIKNTHNIVVHESALPTGKGWSPLTWQVLEGKNEIPITLFEAVKSVDAGDVYLRDQICLEGGELVAELREKQATATYSICHSFIDKYPQIVSNKQKQTGEESFYPKRGPQDSELDPSKSILEQFNLLRSVDNESYPAFFYHMGKKYTLCIESERMSDGK